MFRTVRLAKDLWRHSFVHRSFSLILSTVTERTNLSMSRTKRDAPSSSKVETNEEELKYGLELMR